jgi:hypothetical protein
MSITKSVFDSYKLWYYTGHPYEALIRVFKVGRYGGGLRK